jgi:hypothetical protein
MKSMFISYFGTIELQIQNLHEEYIINIKKMLKKYVPKLFLSKL